MPGQLAWGTRHPPHVLPHFIQQNNRELRGRGQEVVSEGKGRARVNRLASRYNTRTYRRLILPSSTSMHTMTGCPQLPFPPLRHTGGARVAVVAIIRVLVAAVARRKVVVGRRSEAFWLDRVTTTHERTPGVASARCADSCTESIYRPTLTWTGCRETTVVGVVGLSQSRKWAWCDSSATSLRRAHQCGRRLRSKGALAHAPCSPISVPFLRRVRVVGWMSEIVLRPLVVGVCAPAARVRGALSPWLTPTPAMANALVDRRHVNWMVSAVWMISLLRCMVRDVDGMMLRLSVGTVTRSVSTIRRRRVRVGTCVRWETRMSAVGLGNGNEGDVPSGATPRGAGTQRMGRVMWKSKRSRTLRGNNNAHLPTTRKARRW